MFPHRLIIFVPSFAIISQKFSDLLNETNFLLKFSKGHNSIKNKVGVTILNLCSLSDGSLYWYQIPLKYLKGFQNY